MGSGDSDGGDRDEARSVRATGVISSVNSHERLVLGDCEPEGSWWVASPLRVGPGESLVLSDHAHHEREKALPHEIIRAFGGK